MTWRVLSRASRLARVQVDEALGLLGLTEAYEALVVESLGDLRKDLSLLDPATPADLFTRELDEALREGRADFAVHSAKDLTLPLASDLVVAALLPASDQTDALVVRAGLPTTLGELPSGTRVGTSSPQRRSALLAVRPDLEVVGIRGTIEERLAQLEGPDVDALIVANCALKRLGLAHLVSQTLPFATHPLQGHLAVTSLRSRADVRLLWRSADLRRNWGRVALVGAGPGDPELLTLKAQRLLRQADIVFNDSLANPKILDGLKAEVRFVGKRGDTGGELQVRINQALYEAVLEGKRVVRLKGGDPMIFGRATEEMDYLEQRMVDVELVPGISSAQAASAYTEIALTERLVSSSVAFCLGYPPERIPVPEADTLVYYMGSSTLPIIVDKVLAAGRSPDTPVGLVRNASLADQQVWIRTLGGLKEELAERPEHPYASPLLVFVGPVVRAERASSWFYVLPRVWYTGTSIDHFTHPAKLIHQPLIQIVPLENNEALDTQLRRLKGFEWVIFTSRHTVDAVFARLGALGLDARAFAHCRLAAVGTATAEALLGHGLRADRVPRRESSTGLVEEFKAAGDIGQRTKILLPASDQALSVLPDGLRALGAEVTTVAAYQNRAVAERPEGVDLETLDEVILTSPSTARVFANLYSDVPGRLLLVPMGEQTRLTLEALFPGRVLGPSVLDGREA